MRIYIYRKVFEKGYMSNWSKEIFILYKSNNTIPYTYKIRDIKNKYIQGNFFEQELQKTEKA